MRKNVWNSIVSASPPQFVKRNEAIRVYEPYQNLNIFIWCLFMSVCVCARALVSCMCGRGPCMRVYWLPCAAFIFRTELYIKISNKSTATFYIFKRVHMHDNNENLDCYWPRIGETFFFTHEKFACVNFWIDADSCGKSTAPSGRVWQRETIRRFLFFFFSIFVAVAAVVDIWAGTQLRRVSELARVLSQLHQNRKVLKETRVYLRNALCVVKWNLKISIFICADRMQASGMCADMNYGAAALLRMCAASGSIRCLCKYLLWRHIKPSSRILCENAVLFMV